MVGSNNFSAKRTAPNYCQTADDGSGMMRVGTSEEKASKVIHRLRNLPVSLISPLLLRPCSLFFFFLTFAHFFSPAKALLTADFEIGHYIRERIVPRAVLFFTGEALEDESDVEEEESDEDEDEDSDNDADFDPSKAQANPECKQQ